MDEKNQKRGLQGKQNMFGRRHHHMTIGAAALYAVFFVNSGISTDTDALKILRKKKADVRGPLRTIGSTNT